MGELSTKGMDDFDKCVQAQIKHLVDYSAQRNSLMELIEIAEAELPSADAATVSEAYRRKIEALREELTKALETVGKPAGVTVQ